MLEGLRAGDWHSAEDVRTAFLEREDLRNRLSPILVLHEAVRLAGIAETGPALQLLTNLAQEHWAAVGNAAKTLLNRNFERRYKPPPAI